MKKRLKSLILSATLCVASIPFAGTVNVNAEDFPLEILSSDYYDQEIDWDLWDKFLKYDLCITDYDALTAEEQELCKFIFETERSATGTIRCERARRTLAGDTDLGERMAVEELSELTGIYDKYYTKEAHANEYYKYIYCNYRHCVPDVMHIDGDIGVSEYWIDEVGDERVLCQGFVSTFTYYPYFAYCEFDESASGWITNKIEKREMDVESNIININGINYTILPDNTASIVGIDNDTFGSEIINEPLIIPESVNGYPVTAIEMSVFGATGFTEIELPDSITYIGPMAFNNCQYLHKINLPEKLEFMGEYAFQNTNSLSQIEINCPELVIPSFAFLCSGLTEISLNVEKVDEKAFKDSYKLEKVFLGDNVAVIAANAFEGCTAIDEVNMLSTSAHIGQGAFSISTELDSVTIPKNIEIIGVLPEAKGLIMFSGWEPVPANDPSLTNQSACLIPAA